MKIQFKKDSALGRLAYGKDERPKHDNSCNLFKRLTKTFLGGVIMVVLLIIVFVIITVCDIFYVTFRGKSTWYSIYMKIKHKEKSQVAMRDVPYLVYRGISVPAIIIVSILSLWIVRLSTTAWLSMSLEKKSALEATFVTETGRFLWFILFVSACVGFVLFLWKWLPWAFGKFVKWERRKTFSTSVKKTSKNLATLAKSRLKKVCFEIEWVD